ncbi:MAG: MtsA protein [Deltaproteobacteria bacterium]|nr:MtsA protein [Deltaproteobacteria bacterium]
MVGSAVGAKLCGTIGGPPRVALTAVSPLAASNQTAYPLLVFGRGFTAGLKLRLTGSMGKIELTTDLVDETHLTALLPAGFTMAPEVVREHLRVELLSAKGSPLPGRGTMVIINDTGFPELAALAITPDGRRAFVADRTGDRLWMVGHRADQRVQVPVGDRPRAIAPYDDGRNTWLAIAQERAGEILLVPTSTASRIAARHIPVSVGTQAIAFDAGRRRAYLSNLVLDAVEVIDLEAGRAIASLSVGVNPGALALSHAGAVLWVTHGGSEDLWRIDLATEPPTSRRVEIGPGAHILGGHTEPLSPQVMGGKPARAMRFDDRRGVLFLATIGPSIGPNQERMEVSMNGGISVVGQDGVFLRHLSLLRGVPQDLALDAERGLLYVADISTGRVVVLDAALLAESDEAARGAILGEIEIRPPPELPSIRPAGDYEIEGRSSVALHSGPSALALLPGARSLLVLSRFTGALTEVDLSEARAGKLRVRGAWASIPIGAQRLRRQGETLYYTDLGNTRMTCDTCHPEGHDGGLLFTKSEPIQIYRSPNIRSAHDSAPFFTPASLPSLAATAKIVLRRNRFNNPPPTRAEVSALTEYTLGLVSPPNPFRSPSGGLPRQLELPDGKVGDAVSGLRIFEGKGACAECHPAPHYTLDQDPMTRGRLFEVGTPLMLPLRLELQDQRRQGVPPPSLVGLWDNFPLLYSGAGGFDATPDGRVIAAHPFAARRVLELRGKQPHGQVAQLTDEEIDDLLAFLQSI